MSELPATATRGADAAAKQRDYYRRTAAAYDDLHEEDSAPHRRSLEIVAAHLDRIGARTVLDTGCGTGRAMRHLGELRPGLELHGNDPSPELLEIARASGVPTERLVNSASDPLPFADDSFDAVLATAVLHHVPRPEHIVAEMLRVARRAIFISDWNIYGAGPMPARIVKVALSGLALLRPLNWIRRRGRHWYYSDEDGVAFSYSVFDSIGMVRRACAEVEIVGVDGPDRAGRSPRLHSPVCLLSGFLEPAPGRPDA